MKLTSSSSWSERRSSIDQDDITTETINLDALVAGLFGLMFGVFVYAGAIFVVIRILEWQEAIDFTIGWWPSLLLSLIYVVMRSIDKAFFRTRI